MKITIDTKNKTATIVLDMLAEPSLSSSGDTSAIAEKVNNQDTGLKHIDGRPIKLSVNLYVKSPKV